ncbi:unnamed protein product [Rhodiola kirilowii]
MSSLVSTGTVFNGTNFAEWIHHMRLHMRGQRLLDFLTGELPCPPCPTPPTMLVLPADVSAEVKQKASAEFDDAMESFHNQYTTFRTWMDEDARASSIIVASMEVSLSSDIVCLESAQLMWAHLQERYAPTGDSLFLSVVHREQSLQQGNATIDEFYDQMSAIRAQLLARHPRVTILDVIHQIRTRQY